MIDHETLRNALDAAVAAEHALDTIDDAQTADDVDGLTERDRRARERLLGLLRDLAGELDQDAAIVGPDGAIAARSIEADGLALVPPDRVVRLEPPAPADRDAAGAARLRRWRGECLRTKVEPIILIGRRGDGGLDVLHAEGIGQEEVADFCWAASLLISERARQSAGIGRLESNDAGGIDDPAKSVVRSGREGIPGAELG